MCLPRTSERERERERDRPNQQLRRASRAHRRRTVAPRPPRDVACALGERPFGFDLQLMARINICLVASHVHQGSTQWSQRRGRRAKTEAGVEGVGWGEEDRFARHGQRIPRRATHAPARAHASVCALARRSLRGLYTAPGPASWRASPATRVGLSQIHHPRDTSPWMWCACHTWTAHGVQTCTDNR